MSSLQPEEVEKKWRSVSTHLEAATVGNKNRMFLTYCSGASILAHPNALAQLINPRLHEYLTGYVGQNKRFGIVTMDFPGAKLVQTIIGFNYWDSTAGRQDQYAWNSPKYFINWHKSQSYSDSNYPYPWNFNNHDRKSLSLLANFGISDLINLCDKFLS